MKTKNYLLLILGGLVILGGLAAGLISSQKPQEIRKKASTPQGVATISLSPAVGTYQVDQSFPVSIKFDPKGIAISTIALRITYPFSGQTPEVSASNIQIDSQLLSSGDWTCPIKQIYSENGRVTIDISCANTNPSGFTTSRETTLASFTLTPSQLPASNPVVLSFDPTETKINRKSDGTDILSTPTSTGSYTITSRQITPTPTLTPSPGPTPTPTLTPTLTPTPTVAQGERCRLSTSKQNYVIGEPVTIYVFQNPKFADNNYCYYGSLNVKENGQIICTATGFNASNQTQSCVWNTNGAGAGQHHLETFYGGHSDNGGVIPTPPGTCNPNIPCCDGAYTCRTTITLLTPTPTPTLTPSPTPIPTPPPSQVKVKFKVKFAGVESQTPDQKVKVKIGKGGNILQEISQVNLTANNQGIYESPLITLSSTISSGSNYYLLIKGPKHLQTRFCQNSGQSRPCLEGKITLTDGENILDFSSYPLPGGDLPPQDGVVNAIDAVNLTNCLLQTSSACLEKADLNFDGIVTAIDADIMNNTIYTRWEDE